MSEFFKWLSSNSIAANTLIIAFGALITSVNLIFVIAFFQGREVTFWPPKVGTRSNDIKRSGKDREYQRNLDVSHELDEKLSSLANELVDMRARFAFEEQVIVALPRDVVREISKLFSTRDDAVLEGDKRKFIETQLEEKEIPDGASRGYINIQKLKTSILRISPVKLRLYEDIDVDYLVLVREDYVHNNRHTHSSYLGYDIATTKHGLKIVANRSIFE